MEDSKKKETPGELPSKSSKGSPKPLPESLLKQSAIDFALEQSVDAWIIGNMKEAEDFMKLAYKVHHMTDDEFKKYRESMR